MQFIRKSGSLFLLFVLLALAATACGDSDAGDDMAMDGMEMGMNAAVPEELDTATSKPSATSGPSGASRTWQLTASFWWPAESASKNLLGTMSAWKGQRTTEKTSPERTQARFYS